MTQKRSINLFGILAGALLLFSCNSGSDYSNNTPPPTHPSESANSDYIKYFHVSTITPSINGDQALQFTSINESGYPVASECSLETDPGNGSDYFVKLVNQSNHLSGELMFMSSNSGTAPCFVPITVVADIHSIVVDNETKVLSSYSYNDGLGQLSFILPGAIQWDSNVTNDMDIFALQANLKNAPIGTEINLFRVGGTYKMSQIMIGEPHPIAPRQLGDFRLHGNHITLTVWDDWSGLASPNLPYYNDGVFYNIVAGPSSNGPISQPTTTFRITFINGGGIKQNGSSVGYNPLIDTSLLTGPDYVEVTIDGEDSVIDAGSPTYTIIPDWTSAIIDRGGSPNVVRIPSTNNSFVPGTSITITGTVNYNGIHTILPSSDPYHYIEIESPYYAGEPTVPISSYITAKKELFTGTGSLHIILKNGATAKGRLSKAETPTTIYYDATANLTELSGTHYTMVPIP